MTDQLTTEELMKRCAKRPADEDAWQEFVRRYHHVIRGNVVKTFNLMVFREKDRHPQFYGDTIDDLVQVVYLHLVKQNSHALNRFKGKYDESIFRYLAVISINAVRDHFREARALRRPRITFSLDELLENAGEGGILRDAICGIDGEPLESRGTKKITMEEIDSALKKVVASKHRNRDILMYKLRYLDGLTLEEIRNALGLEMSSVGVGSILKRINDRLRRRLTRLT